MKNAARYGITHRLCRQGRSKASPTMSPETFPRRPTRSRCRLKPIPGILPPIQEWEKFRPKRMEEMINSGHEREGHEEDTVYKYSIVCPLLNFILQPPTVNLSLSSTSVLYSFFNFLLEEQGSRGLSIPFASVRCF